MSSTTSSPALTVNQLHSQMSRLQSIGLGRKTVAIDLRQLGIPVPEGMSPLVRVTGVTGPVLVATPGEDGSIGQEGAETGEQVVALTVEAAQ